MDEQQHYGKEGLEHDAGYFPIPEPAPAVPDEPEHTEAIQTWSNNREQEAAAKPIIDRSYVRTDGEKVGEHYPDAGTVSADRAAKELAETRKAEAAVAELDRQQQLAAEIDAARGLAQQTEQPAPEVLEVLQQQTEPQQQSTPTYDSGIDPDVATALRNPKVLNAIHQERAAYVTAAETAFNNATAFAQQNAEIAAAAILSRPELRGIPANQLPGALLALRQANPEAAAQIQSQLYHLQTLTQQAAAAQQQQQQHAAAAFQEFAKASDDAFENSGSSEPPEAMKAVREYALQMFRDAGLTDQQLAYHWRTNPLMRSVTGQQIIADAARYRMLKAGIKPAPKPVPQVARPGSSMDRPAAADRDAFAFEQRFGGPKAPLSAKQAAELVIGRRARAAR